MTLSKKLMTSTALALILAGPLLAQSPSPSPSPAPSAPAAPISAEKNGFGFSLVVAGDKAEITMSYKTAGWVAVGFNPVQAMKGADFIIAYVKDGKAYARDDYGPTPVSHASDLKAGGTDDVTLIDWSEAEGMTTVRFSIPRLAAHHTDSSLGQGKHRVIMAAGPKDDFSSKHIRTAGFDIVIP